MKKIRINKWQVGLLFRNGAYREMLKEGVYWVWGAAEIRIYETAKQFFSPVELDVLLQDPALKAELDVIEVKDNSIVLQYEHGALKQVLTAGRYAFWKSVVNYTFIWADTSRIEIEESISRTALMNTLLVPFVRTYTIESQEKGLLFVDGKYAGMLEPGVYNWWKNSIIITLAKADTRMQQAEVNGQDILTRDKAALRINAWAQYRVIDIEQAILHNKEYEKQLYICFQLALREYVAQLTFDELLQKKEGIVPFALEFVKDSAAALGVQVHGFGIRDIILPGEMKDIMNQVLIAEKKAQANSIMRREETASTRSLLNTAKLMEENAMLWKLKEMEYVEKIAEKINNISVNGNGLLIDQLKQLFISRQ